MNRIRNKIITKSVFCFGVFIFLLAMSSVSAFAKDKIDKVISRAEQGDAQAQYELASRYEKGEGIKKNIDEALKWYRKAAENGHAGAQVDLGWFYQKGQFVEKNIKQAIALYTKAANRGNPQAQLNLAVLYDGGVEVPEDNKSAVKWYKLAAEQGSEAAQLNLGVNYWKGEGVEQNYEKAWNILNHLRITASDRKIKWRTRGILDQIKEELGVSGRFGETSYPSWEELKCN
jgi:TPR repeat protein